MSQQTFSRTLTDRARAIPLPAVLSALGAEQDREDSAKWHTPAGPLSIQGEKFFLWRQAQGGGGAIDIIVFVLQMDFRSARSWLDERFGLSCQIKAADDTWITPRPCREHLPAVIDYLHLARRIPIELIQTHVRHQQIHADARKNAVFVLLGKEKLPVGAELRATGSYPWKGMARGSQKNAGFFYTGDPRSHRCVLCESAIDALSCRSLYPERLCLSTSGVSITPAYLPKLLRRGYEIYCGYDNDPAGESFAQRMIQAHPVVRRLRPRKKDWNEDLLAH